VAPVTAIVLVGMSIAEANEQDALRRRAAETDATLAFLQHGEPSLTTELTRLADAGETTIRLEPVALGERSPARSWLRRVAGHWLREAAHRPTILIGDTEVTGSEAGMTSPAWQEVPSHSRHVLVCRGPRCSARGAEATADAIGATLGELGLGDDDVLVTQTGCLFPCNNAPVMVVHPDDAWFGGVDAHAARRILIEYLVWGMPVHPHRLSRKRRSV
jgi:(2Fe-2S) ferredoxin